MLYSFPHPAHVLAALDKSIAKSREPLDWGSRIQADADVLRNNLKEQAEREEKDSMSFKSTLFQKEEVETVYKEIFHDTDPSTNQVNFTGALLHSES